MQKFIFIEAQSGGTFGLDEINPLLERGWKVVEIHASSSAKKMSSLTNCSKGLMFVKNISFLCNMEDKYSFRMSL